MPESIIAVVIPVAPVGTLASSAGVGHGSQLSASQEYSVTPAPGRFPGLHQMTP